MKSFSLAAAFLIVCLGTPSLADPFSGQGSSESSTSVLIDAHKALSVSGRNDLAVIRDMFKGASLPGNVIDRDWDILSSVGVSTLRSINQVRAACSIAEGGESASNCAALDAFLSVVDSHHLIPHIVVGQFKPDHGVPDRPFLEWDSKALKVYQQQAADLVRYVALHYGGHGFHQVEFEVSNEIDNVRPSASGQTAWAFGNQNEPRGSEIRYQALLQLYSVWAKAVDEVARENPDRILLVGGPATTGWTILAHQPQPFETRFVSDVSKLGLRMDFFSMHHYGNPGRRSITNELGKVRHALESAGKASTPIYLTEWGPSYAVGADSRSKVNYQNTGAAWTASFLCDAVAAGASEGLLLLTDDQVTGPLPNRNWVSFVLLYPENATGPYTAYAKPATNVMRMFTLLPGTRRSVSVKGSADIGAIASASGTAAGVIVYNSNYDFTHDKDLSRPQHVTASISGLPFDGAVTVSHYAVDAKTSNVGRFIDSGLSPVAAQTNLQLIGQSKARVDRGMLDFPRELLQPSSVSLWIVTKD
jgi:Glycosyl hydrolases family 39